MRPVGTCAALGVRATIWSAAGDGAPLLLFHGFLGRPESFGPLLPFLGDARPVIAISLPGHDPLGPAEPALGWNGTLDRLAGALDAFGFAPAHALGYSLGARVVLGLLVRWPGLFGRATLVGVNPGLAGDAERDARRAADARWSALLRDAGAGAFLDAWEAQPLFATQRALAPDVLAAQRALRETHDAAALASALDVLGLAEMPDYRASLPSITVPVDLVAGSEDAKFRTLAEEMLALLPNATLHVVDGAGHNVVLERPEALAGIIEEK